MEIVNLSPEHIPAASQLAVANYLEERQATPSLPLIDHVPDLMPYVQNNLGVAAIENGQCIGFLACNPPREHAFHTHARGIFSPIHAHGARPENRTYIYQRMYQVAAHKWLLQNIHYHSIGLYAHDEQALRAFFWNGFGLRCLDGIRTLAPLNPSSFTANSSLPTSITLRELRPEESFRLRPLRQLLHAHLGQSPCFMQFSPEELTAELDELELHPPRSFAAFSHDSIMAYYELSEEAETFITSVPSMQNICGAYCLPEFRSQGISKALLFYMAHQLAAEGYEHLGVDCESFNLTAAHFWPKHFDMYTHGLTRRIDECAWKL